MRKYLLYLSLAALAAGLLFGWPFYQNIFGPSIRLEGGADTYDFYIPTGSDYIAVGDKLIKERVLTRPEGFHWVAKRMNYPRLVKPGRYVLKNGMNNRELIELLRSGKQTPIRYTFIKFRTLDDMVAQATDKFEFSARDLQTVLSDSLYLLKEYGLKPATTIGIFVPNTYEIYWNTTAKGFVKRMYEEYRRFWNSEREEKRRKLKLERMEVMTLASIVEEETNKNDEKPTVAGVYLNRIRVKMPLQADPTVKFAVGDFALTRILDVHTATPSPYNTYVVLGLPPGPICTPSIPSVDAVLNAPRHDYLYFCAKADGSGYHQFSKTLEEHNQYANAYHRMLDEMRRQQAQQGLKQGE